jgi:hypothetical protein
MIEKIIIYYKSGRRIELENGKVKRYGDDGK